MTVIYQIIMKGQRDCGWLLIGSLNHCGKSCLGEYCNVHLARIRRESPIPIPCRRCGKGTQSETYLSGLCGADRAQKYLVRAEARLRRIHRRVMDEIRYRSLWAKKLTFVGLLALNSHFGRSFLTDLAFRETCDHDIPFSDRPHMTCDYSIPITWPLWTT